MTPDQQARLLELFVACSQETLAEAQHGELQVLLRADAEARRLWFLHQDLELGLKCLTQVAKETVVQPGKQAAADKDSANAHVEPGIRLPTSGDSSRAVRVGRRNPAIAVTALLCLFAVAMFSVHIWTRPPVSDNADHRAGSFVVESPTHGSKFTLSDHKGKVVALHFLLKTECPFCLKLVHDYAQLAASDPDVLHLFLKPDSTDEIKAWAGKINHEGLKTPPVIYRDPDARLAKEFGIPEGYQFHGQTGHYPALVLIDSSGKELFRYVGKENTDRMKPDDFIARLAMVTDRK